MRLPLDWLREYFEFDESAEELANKLDLTGTEVEAIHRDAAGFEGVVVGKVLTVEKHPNADRLTYDEVDVGTHVARIICGAPNVEPGMNVPVALPGATLPNGMTIEGREVRGVVSEGMMCAEDELELGDDHSGIMKLADHLAPGTPVSDALGLGEPVLEMEVTPNRPDCLSVRGLARELAAGFARKVDLPEPGMPPADGSPASDLVTVDIDDPEDCPRYVAMVIEGLTIKPSPPAVQERLRAMGARPINNIVDVTNLVMFEMGQPLHAFDYDKVAEGHIIVRRADEGEQLTTLDGEERELDPGMLVIADPKGAVALAGVMGGAASEVSDSTTRVLLESANFHAPLIMRTSRGLGLLSEASSRFEKGVDPNGALAAAVKAAEMMADLGGGKVLAGAVDAYPKVIEPWPLILRPSRANEILGTDFGEKTMSEVLERLGCDVKLKSERGQDPALAVTVPTFRPDLGREIDLVEEVARLVGYDKIPATLPEGAGRIGRLTRAQQVQRKMSEVLRAAGVSEAVSMGFVDPDDVEALRWPMPPSGPVLLVNPVAKDQSALRPAIIIELLRAVRHNRSVGEDEIALYETGRVWPGSSDDGIPAEERRLAIALSGSWLPRQWHSSAEPFDTYDLVGVLEDLRDGLRLTDFELTASDHPSLMPGQALSVACGGKHAGVAGTLHPDVAEGFDLDDPVFVAELSLDALVDASSDLVDFVEPARYPAVERDLAVVVGSDLAVGELVDTARDAGSPLLAEISVFDVYRGEGIPAGKKSIAMGLYYRASDRTLTDDEVDGVHATVLKALADAHGATRR